MVLRPFAALLLATGACAVRAADVANSMSLIGPNALLTEGTEAMMAEQWRRGIDLLEQGVKLAVASVDQAAAFSNLCAGYVALRDYDRALENCDRALAIDPENWRTYNNRAGALLGKGRLDEALHDVDYGLALNPEGAMLLKMNSLVRAQLKSLYTPRRPAAEAASQS